MGVLALLSPLWGFLSNPIVAVALALAGAWWWHSHDKAAAIRAHDEKATIERRAAVAEFVTDISARNAKLAADLAREKTNVRTETVRIVQEVPKYVTPLADSRCVVPVGFVQHHDAAWGLSALPPAAGGLVDKPSGIPLSRVESTVAENAGAAREWRAEALGWRKWYAARKEEWDSFARSTAGQPRKVP